MGSQSREFIVNMKSLQLAFTLVLLSFKCSRASGKVTSCLSCESTNDTLGNWEGDLWCPLGGFGTDLLSYEVRRRQPRRLAAGMCFVYVSNTDGIGISLPPTTTWKRGCCSNLGEDMPGWGCADIHKDSDNGWGADGSFHQTWCSKDDCNDMNPRSIREVEPSTTTTKTTTTTITTTTTTSTTTTPDSSKAGALVPVFTVAVIASTS